MFLKSFVNKLRYLVWASPIVWLALLNGCGSGTVLDPFVPTRIIAFGDASMDVRTPRFTVNDEIPLESDASYITASTYGAVTQFQKGTATPISSTNYYVFAFNSLFGINGYLNTNTAIPYFSPLSIYDGLATAVVNTTTNAIDTPINPELTIIERIAADYGFGAVIPMNLISSHQVPSKAGVYSFAQANALVMNLPNTVGDVPQSFTANYSYGGGTVSYGGSATRALSVQAQIDLFLTNNSIAASDLIVINAGTADVMYQASAAGTGSAGVGTAAQNFADQIMNLYNHGAKHIVVFGPPNMGRSPFAYKYGLTTTLSNYSKTLNAHTSCTLNPDFNCTLELALQNAFGTVSQNPILFIDISSQTSLITGTVNTGTSNSYQSFADPLYGVALSFPGDPSFSDISANAPANATDGNYYCNQTNIPSAANSATYPVPFYISSPGMTGTFTDGTPPSFVITGSACFANPALPRSTNAVLNSYATASSGGNLIYNYLSYAYADPVYFTPSVNRMLADFIISKLSLASWR